MGTDLIADPSISKLVPGLSPDRIIVFVEVVAWVLEADLVAAVIGTSVCSLNLPRPDVL